MFFVYVHGVWVRSTGAVYLDPVQSYDEVKEVYQLKVCYSLHIFDIDFGEGGSVSIGVETSVLPTDDSNGYKWIKKDMNIHVRTWTLWRFVGKCKSTKLIYSSKKVTHTSEL